MIDSLRQYKVIYILNRLVFILLVIFTVLLSAVVRFPEYIVTPAALILTALYVIVYFIDSNLKKIIATNTPTTTSRRDHDN